MIGNMRYFLLALLTGLLILPGAAHCKNTITIGRATDNINEEHKRLDPIVQYLAHKLKDMGIGRGKVVLDGFNDDQAIARLIKTGELDIIIESPFSSAYYKYHTGAYPILLVSREGVIEYNSYIFTRKESPVHGLSDLESRTIAFEDATSTSSYHLPRLAIEEAGQDLEMAGNIGQKSEGGHVRYVFAGSELNVSSWVFFKKVDAGALSSKDWLDQEECPQAFRKHFRIIHKTRFIPRMMVLVRKNLPPDLVKRIKTELLNMHRTEQGLNALSYYKLDRFVDFPDTADQLLESIQKRLFPNP